MTLKRSLFVGLTFGVMTSALAMWLRRGQLHRLSLAQHIDAMTQQAVQQLGVPAQSKFIAVNGLRLHTVVAGPDDAPLIILLHGFPECWYGWHYQIAPLVQAGYRVVVPDQRGYNLSDKPLGIHNYRMEALASDGRELMRVFQRERAIIVGHDWGGQVAWRMAMDYPEVIEKMMILNSPHPAAFAREIRENPAQQRRSWYMLFFQLPWLPEALLGQSPIASANLFFRQSAINQNAYSSYDLHYLATAFSQPGALSAMINWYRASFRERSNLRLRPIDTPTLMLWGEDDAALGKSLTYSYEGWVSNLKIHYIPNCGHWVQNEAADEVNTQILEFL